MVFSLCCALFTSLLGLSRIWEREKAKEKSMKSYLIPCDGKRNEVT